MAQIRAVQTSQGAAADGMDMDQSRQCYGYLYRVAPWFSKTPTWMPPPLNFDSMFGRWRPEQRRSQRHSAWNGLLLVPTIQSWVSAGYTVGGADDGNIKLLGMRFWDCVSRCRPSVRYRLYLLLWYSQSRASRLHGRTTSGPIAFVGSSGSCGKIRDFLLVARWRELGRLWINKSNRNLQLLRFNGAFSLIQQTMSMPVSLTLVHWEES